MKSKKNLLADPYSKLSPQAREKIGEAEKKYNLFLGIIIKKYGIFFTLRLIKSTTKGKKHKPETEKVEIIFPEVIKKAIHDTENIFDKNFNEYVQEIEDAGFNLCRNYEPFVDEDTEKVYIVQRHYIYFLNNK